MIQRKTIIAVALTAATVAGAGALGYPYLIKSGYEDTLARLNEIEGVTATSSFVNTGVFKTTGATTIKLDGKHFILPTSNKDGVLTIEVTHEIDHLSYPVEVKHEAALDEASSAEINEALGRNSSQRFVIPTQLVSLHDISGNSTFLGMTDHIKIASTPSSPSLDVSPMRFNVSYDKASDNLVLNSIVEKIQSQNPINGKTTTISDLSYTWEGVFGDCDVACPNTTQFAVDSIYSQDKTGQRLGSIENLGAAVHTTVGEELLRFDFNVDAKAFISPSSQWKDFKISFSMEDLKIDALTNLVRQMEQVSSADEAGFLGQSQMPRIYARFIQTGMTMKLNSFSAVTDYGDVNANFKLVLPADEMPDMVNNPMGLWQVMRGEMHAKVPTAEFDRLFGQGSHQQILKMGFARADGNGQYMTSEMKVENGEAKINGRAISL